MERLRGKWKLMNEKKAEGKKGTQRPAVRVRGKPVRKEGAEATVLPHK